MSVDSKERAQALSRILGSSDSFKYRRLENIRFELFDFSGWAFDRTSFDQVLFSFCVLPKSFEGALRHARGLQISDCTWWPEEGPQPQALREAKDELREVLRRFIISIAPLKIRNEIAKEKMTKDFHISDKNAALRCLRKAGVVRIVLQAASEEYYVLDTTRLDELVRFVRDGIGLDNVVSCMLA